VELVSCPRNKHIFRCDQNGPPARRQIPKLAKATSESGFKYRSKESSCQLMFSSILGLAPFQGEPLDAACSAGLKPWAETCCPFGTKAALPKVHKDLQWRQAATRNAVPNKIAPTPPSGARELLPERSSRAA
jgi:hypothetical protein